MFSSTRVMVITWVATILTIASIIFWANAKFDAQLALQQKNETSFAEARKNKGNVNTDRLNAANKNSPSDVLPVQTYEKSPDTKEDGTSIPADTPSEKIAEDNPMDAVVTQTPAEDMGQPTDMAQNTTSLKNSDKVNLDNKTQEKEDISETPATVPPAAMDTVLTENTAQTPTPRAKNTTPIPTITPTPAMQQNAWQQYASKVVIDPNLKQIAIVMTNMGLRPIYTEAAMKDLSPAITFGFSPYADALDYWTKMATNNGNEFLLMMPMEPMSYPSVSPGPLGLLVDASKEQNDATFNTLLNSTSGYIGFIGDMGSRYSADYPSMMATLQNVKNAGYVFVDSRSTAKSVVGDVATELGLAYASNHRFLDNSRKAEDIQKQLERLENRARKYGSAIGVITVHNTSITVIQQWQSDLEARGFQLVPISALLKK